MNRFSEEAKQLCRFRHDSGIVTCLDFFRKNGTAYLVMVHEDAMPLSKLLERREADGGPFGEAELLSVALPLLESLLRLHKGGILHRDIKPSNILIRREDDRPVLIDFGAAKQTVTLQTKSLAPYTEGYAAIEQVGDGDLGTWTDLYGIGAVLWRIVAGGEPPWKPPNPTRVENRLIAIARGSPDPLPKAREIGAGRFSDDVLDAIDRCLVLPEADRIQNCGQLLQKLRSSSAHLGQRSDTNKNKTTTGSRMPEYAGPDYSDHQSLGAYELIRKALVGILIAFFLFIGRGLRESPDEELFATSLVIHLFGMIAMFVAFFRQQRTTTLSPSVAERHWKPLAICWYILGASMLIRAINSSEFHQLFLAVSAMSAVTATGILYRRLLGLSTAVVLSFLTSMSIEGFGIACYTWWVSSLRANSTYSGTDPNQRSDPDGDGQ